MDSHQQREEMSSNSKAVRSLRTLIPYKVPSWASHLKGVPSNRLKLGMSETPIQQWYADLPGGFSLDIKRDDMTGFAVTGSKVRMAEIMMAEAIKKGCTHVLACGEEFSNKCRTVAVVAAQLKMECHVFQRSQCKDAHEIGYSGNQLLNRMTGAHVSLFTNMADVTQRMEDEKRKLTDSGANVLCIPCDETYVPSIYGYMDVFQELINQGSLENYDDIIVSLGSGGIAGGLCIGNYLTGSKVRIHGVAVSSDTVPKIRQDINELLKALGLNDVRCEDILHIIEGYKGIGYGESSREELDFLVKISSETGIFLDPTYTGKAVKGLFEEIEKNPQRFQGKRLLFFHSGGGFALFDGRMKNMIMDNPVTNRVAVN